MDQAIDVQAEALKKLRAQFETHHIGKKPMPTKKQTEELHKDFRVGQRCAACGGWHQPEVQHIDYIGHAAITARLLDVDPHWNWEPVALDAAGLPAIDKDGGLWIRLTVAGMTRLGYGDAGDKSGPNATKERIGDALRNAGMRFGMALELWHKGVLEMEPERFESKPGDVWIMRAEAAGSRADLEKVWTEGARDFIERKDKPGFDAFKASATARAAELERLAAQQPPKEPA